MQFLSFALVAVSIVSGHVIRPRAGGDPPFQSVPTTAQPDNTFNNSQLMAPVESGLPAPDVYGARSFDLPFNRLYHGKMKFFSKGQLNSPDRWTDQNIDQPGVIDSAKQSACGIPDNAFSGSKVAIHPYFLKFMPLERYCMQDVCISFWNGKTGEASSDMMLKVTDVCSTDPKDPTHCAHPGEIKVDRTKVWVMEKLTAKPLESYPSLTGNEFTDGVSYWFFVKCWADGLVQAPYQDNWFAKPPLPNNLTWSQNTATEQWRRNQDAYPLHNPAFPKYTNNAYNPRYDSTTSPPIPDWSPSDPDPEWCPVAGGKGWGIPTGKNCGGSQQAKPSTEESSTSTAVSSTAETSSKALVASTFGSQSTPTIPASAVVAEPAVSSSAAQENSVAALATSSSFDVAVIPSSTSSGTTSSSSTSSSAAQETAGAALAESSSTDVAVIATLTSSAGEVPSTTSSSEPTSTSGVSPGLDGLATLPKGKQNEDSEDEVCDLEPEVEEAPQKVVEEENDTCEWE